MSRLDHAARPSRYTDHDRAVMAAAVARGDHARAAEKRKQRVARLAVCATAIALAVSLFYSLSN